MAFQGNSSELDLDQDNDTPITPVLSDTETKSILGYTCKKATIQDGAGNVTTYWYTTKIKRPDGLSQMPEEIPGLCLEFEVQMQDQMTLIYTAVELDKKVNMGDFKVEIPEGVEVRSLSDLKNIGAGGE